MENYPHRFRSITDYNEKNVGYEQARAVDYQSSNRRNQAATWWSVFEDRDMSTQIDSIGTVNLRSGIIITALCHVW
uniref:Uncharacterized protein n=1 Tax=Glossina palpalis gambiensis TaxID=67801 RepID=A0A1B0ANM3_9MUSC